MNTPGALLFHFSSEPQPGGGRPSAAHVASSLGNASMFGGQTLATTTAATAVPVTAPVTDAAPTIDPHRTAQRFVDAALDQRGDAYRLGAEADLSNADPGAFEIDPGVDIGDPGADSEHDGLTNQFETMIGTNPTAADSDLDGLLDGVEVSAGTDPMLMDTDLDGYTDGMESTWAWIRWTPTPVIRPTTRCPTSASTCTEWRPVTRPVVLTEKLRRPEPGGLARRRLEEPLAGRPDQPAGPGGGTAGVGQDHPAGPGRGGGRNGGPAGRLVPGDRRRHRRVALVAHLARALR